VFHLSNGVDTQKFRPETGTEQARKALASDRACVVLYAGLHGLAQGLDQLLLAADKLQENSDLSFTLIGDGPEKANLLAQAEKAQLANVQFLNPRPADEIPALVAAADIALVMLKTHIPGAVPSKLYEAMASGRPVILAAEGEAAQLVRENRTGITVAPGDISGLINAIETLRADPALRRSLGINGRITAEALFDRIKIVRRFIDFLEETLRDSRKEAAWSRTARLENRS
jgi:glycosyltransferase involved in cell wall biosynthesis